MDPDDVGEVAESDPAQEDSGDVTIEEAVAALGRRGDEPVRLPGQRGHRQAQSNDDATDGDTDGDAEGETPDAGDEQVEADDDGNEPDDEGDARRPEENTRAKYKRQRDEARQEVEGLRARDAEWGSHYAKIEQAYGKVQEDFDDLQADFEEMAEYTKELERELREQVGWEPDATKVKLRETTRENRKLKRAQERTQRHTTEQQERQTLAERTVEARKIADQTRQIATKFKVDVKELATAAAAILATNQLPDLEKLARALAMQGKIAQDAKAARAKGQQAPRRIQPRRAPRPSNNEDLEHEAVSFMKEKWDKEGRVFPTR